MPHWSFENENAHRGDCPKNTGHPCDGASPSLLGRIQQTSALRKDAPQVLQKPERANRHNSPKNTEMLATSTSPNLLGKIQQTLALGKDARWSFKNEGLLDNAGMPHRDQLPGPLGELANCPRIRARRQAIVVELPRLVTQIRCGPWTTNCSGFGIASYLSEHSLPVGVDDTECLGDLLTSWPISSIKLSGLARADFLWETSASHICDDHGLPLLDVSAPLWTLSTICFAPPAAALCSIAAFL